MILTLLVQRNLDCDFTEASFCVYSINATTSTKLRIMHKRTFPNASYDVCNPKHYIKAQEHDALPLLDPKVYNPRGEEVGRVTM